MQLKEHSLTPHILEVRTQEESWVFPLPKSTIYVFSELQQSSLIVTFNGFNEKMKVDYDIFG
jgi:hypothetical protein